MNTPSDAMPECAAGPQQSAPAAMKAVRPMFWSVRCELWENRSIYIAPLAVAGVLLFGFLVSLFNLPERRRAVLLLEPAKQQAAIQQPYDLAAMMVMVTAIIVGVFYCLDALYGERRDRSILFWKSLPVSDLTAVLSKVVIPLVVLPLLSFAVIVATQLIMLLLSSVVLMMNDLSAATTWVQVGFFQQSLVLLYGLIVLALWHAPIYGWLLLVSAWARRTPFLWAVLPPVVVAVLEKIAFNSSHFAALLNYRIAGGIRSAFAFGPGGRIDSLTQLTPGQFLGTPGLWIGLAFAAAFLAAAGNRSEQERMMGTAKSVGRVIAVLLFAQLATYGVLTDVLLRPVFAAPGFLENAAARPTQMGLAALMGLATGALSVGIAIAALPVFRRYSEATAYWFLALAVVGFSVTAVEQVNLMSLLSLSQAYAGAEAADSDLFQALRGVVASSRNWAHFTALIVMGSVAFVLYSALYRFTLIPRVLAAFGMLAALSQITAVAMPLFGHRVVFMMIYPLGLTHLALVLWLLAKGFEERPGANLAGAGSPSTG